MCGASLLKSPLQQPLSELKVKAPRETRDPRGYLYRCERVLLRTHKLNCTLQLVAGFLETGLGVVISLAVAEMLLQAGFERSSDDALSTLADVFCYSIERCFRRVRAMQSLRFGIYRVPLSFYIYAKNLNPWSYRQREMRAFLGYQASLSSYLREKFKAEGECLLQMLRVLPQRSVKLEAHSRQYQVGIKETKSDVTESREMVVDDFMVSFLENTSKIEAPGEGPRRSYGELSGELAKPGGVPTVVADEDAYERFLMHLRLGVYDHFRNGVAFAKHIGEDIALFGKKVVEKESLG
ncbi:UNVERIFIED_CONTAM: hypothetical protein PYX00_011365 [Menopon gallinae]|uniref:Uncharacterized protein n=1 Tax=Menopon gallinae TaxID=328185 RepID=A0AAW2H7D3_9NEOP